MTRNPFSNEALELAAALAKLPSLLQLVYRQQDQITDLLERVALLENAQRLNVDELVSVKEAAQLRGVSTKTIRRAVAANALAHVRRGRAILVRKSEVA